MEPSILPDSGGVLKDMRSSHGEVRPDPGLEAPAFDETPDLNLPDEFDALGELGEVLATSDSVRARGVMDFFWTGLAPFTLLVVFGTSVVVFALTAYLLDAELPHLLALSGSVMGVGLVVLLPLEYRLVRARILGPVKRLEFELVGKSPWRPERDALLGSLRRVVGEIRRALRTMDNDLRLERERGDDLQARLAERAVAEVFVDRVVEGLRGAESVSQFAVEAGRLVRSVWPADDLLLLNREDRQGELGILAWEHGGVMVDLATLEGEPPRYRLGSLPVPVKEALRSGFCAEIGLPFSQDANFPQARSFVAIGLDHRGGASGVMLALSSRLDPPGEEPLRRSRPLFSMGFGRAMYVRELGEAEIRDALTGAFTHDHFLTLVRYEVARANRYSRPVACLMIDVDDLRRINGEHGSAAGDRVIAEVAQLVAGAIRSSDSLARISGGRLSLLLPETNTEASEVVAERVRSRVEEHPFILEKSQVERATVSVGIAVHPPLGVTAMSLVDAAERALAEAKRGGRNRVTVAAGGPVEPARPSEGHGDAG